MYQVISEPAPHVVVKSKKDFTYWAAGATECVPRLLVNPYNGCTHRCFFCYARALQGYFADFEQDGCVTVFEGLEKNIGEGLRGLETVYPIQLSPATDPFQPVNEKYTLTEKIIAEAVAQSVPVDVISKGRYSDDAIRLMARQKGCIGQVTLLTPREELRKRLMQGAATTEELFENVRRLRSAGVFTIVRIDPIIPGLTDDLDDLRSLIKDVSGAGAQHVIVSAMRIPYRMKERIFQDLSALGVDGKYARELYADWYDGSVHPKWSYREPLFDELSGEAKRRGMTFALCREFVKEEGKLVGLNGRYCTAESCEGEKYVLESQSQRVSESELI